MTKYNTYTLENRLRVIHLPMDSQVVYCGYEIAAGSRDEQPGEEGLAHFCEHMTFKGTERRNALQVINALESVGGELNAFTNKEDTVFYAAVTKEHVAKAVNLLTDIVFHSQYPQHEIDKEVEVICDEIESYNDSPAELIYDEFENLLFEGHPLGHNILGKAELLHTFTTADALRFTRSHYRPDNAVFFVYGDVDFKRLVKLLYKFTVYSLRFTDDLLASQSSFQPMVYSSVRSALPLATAGTQELKPSTVNNKTIFLKIDGEYRQIAISDIIYVSGMKDYVMFYLDNERRPLVTHLTMKAVEEMLPTQQFMRVHRSFIVCLDKIRKVDRNDCIYIGEEIIHVTEAYLPAFQQYLTSKFPGK